MKKLLLLLALVTAFAATAQDKPEAFYLVGTMNDWVSTADGGTQYPLLDEDGDGVYTGTFDIPEMNNGYVEFKVFNKIAGWDDPSAYYGTTITYSRSLFKDRSLAYYISSEGTYNINIDNWQGGTLSVSFDSERQIIELSSSTQPVLPPAPDVYVIGKFNNWQLPRGDSDNGALKLPLASDSFSYTYKGYVNIPAGEADLQFCVMDKQTGDFLLWGSDLPSFTVYNYDGEPKQSFLPLYAYSSTGGYTYNVRNWAGGDMLVEFELYFNHHRAYGAVTGENQPEYPFADTIYAIYDTGSGERELLEVNSLSYYVWCTGPNPTILYTTENSLNPAPENCLGLPEGDEVTEGYHELVKGGKPFSISFKEMGYLQVQAYLALGVAEVYIQDLSTPELPDQLYLIGNITGWNIDETDIVLPMVEETASRRKYEITIDLQEPEPMFRFYTQLGNWDNNTSIGSQYDDYPIGIEVGDEPFWYEAYYPGKGNWELKNWVPGYLKIEVYMYTDNHVSVCFQRTDENAVNEVEGGEGEAVYYNLQGVKLDAPVPGLLIKVQDGKSTKVLVK